MCGILGLMHYSGSAPGHIQAKSFRKAITDLLKGSQIRGSDASGLAVLTDENLSLFKTNLGANDFVKTANYSELLKGINRKDVFRAAIGHTRSMTKGDEQYNINNHPIIANRIVGVHNGVISNDDALFSRYGTDLKRSGEVDSEIIFRLIDYHRRNGKTLVESVQETCSVMSGSFTCAFIDTEEPSYVTIFSNSTYSNAFIYVYESTKTIVFASSEYILDSALEHKAVLDPHYSSYLIEVISEGYRINLNNGKMIQFDIDKKKLSYPLHR